MSAKFSMPFKKRIWTLSTLAVLVAAAGLLDIVFGLAVTFGVRTISIPRLFTLSLPPPYAAYLELRGLSVGALTLAAAVGLERLRPWAWAYTWMVMGMAILFALADFVMWSASLVYTMLAIAVAAVILVYLSRPDVRRVFGRRERAGDDT
jgi:lysylphosphatidylglycerol synthetase-like protein (DUF2156 family)